MKLAILTFRVVIAAALLGFHFSPANAAAKETSSDKPASLPLTGKGRRACSIYVTDRNSSPLVDRAVDAIAVTVHGWSGVDLQIVETRQHKKLPRGRGIVLMTYQQLQAVAPDVIRKSPELTRVKSADEHGFAIVPVADKIFVVSPSIRGVYNGAVYARDFLIDGPADALALTVRPMLREPAMKGRPAYTLSIWAHEQEYTAANWNSIFQSFARDGMDRVYFWFSGHFPSVKYPHTYKVADGPWDTTVNTRIGTLEDQRAIIRYAHDLGMKIYLGGGMGGWVGTGLITHKKPGTMKTGPGEASLSLCPSHPESRTALTEYYLEMFDALPEADGVYIELCEEWGECLCPDCSKPIDDKGSKQYGRSLMGLAKDIAEKTRAKHPHAKFCFTVGYDEHARDPAFYQMMRDMGNEHYEWMEARNRWDFAGPEGKDLPAAHFSKRVMKWKQWYNLPLDSLVEHANRAARSDFYGLITSFEPGFATGSFYKSIPYPTHQLPYILTGFSFREMTWEPTLSLDQLKQRIGDRFFGADANKQLITDLWRLREIMRHSTEKKKPVDMDQELARMSERAEAAWPEASPKTRAGLQLMRTAIADTRKYLAPK